MVLPQLELRRLWGEMWKICLPLIQNLEKLKDKISKPFFSWKSSSFSAGNLDEKEQSHLQTIHGFKFLDKINQSMGAKQFPS